MEKEKKIGEWKGLMVDALFEDIKKDRNFYISNFLGLKAGEINELRRSLESRHAAKYLVVKNSMVKIALEKEGLGDLVKLIDGGTGIVFGGTNSIETAKALTKFSKSHEQLKLRGGYIDGEIIDEARVKYIASLPSKKELITKIVCGMKSPITGFVSVLANTLKSFVFVINAIKDKKAS